MTVSLSVCVGLLVTTNAFRHTQHGTSNVKVGVGFQSQVAMNSSEEEELNLTTSRTVKTAIKSSRTKQDSNFHHNSAHDTQSSLNRLSDAAQDSRSYDNSASREKQDSNSYDNSVHDAQLNLTKLA